MPNAQSTMMMEQAIQALNANDQPKALAVAKQLLQSDPYFSEYHWLLGIAETDYGQSLNHLFRAVLLSGNPEARSKNLIDLINLTIKHQDPRLTFILCYWGIMSGIPTDYFSNILTQITDTKVPGILLATMPKSGSIFLMVRIGNGLSLPTLRQVTSDTWPNDMFNYERLRMLSYGWAIAQVHVWAYPQNLNMLNALMDRIVVHVRDPRQAVVSWTHHVINEKKKRGFSTIQDKVYPPLPADYFAWPFEKQLDYQIENYLPQVAQWINLWLEARRNPNLNTRILFTRYDDLKEQPDELLKRILRFYDIDPQKFPIDASRPNEGELHYRQGKRNEWREVMSPQQRERCAEIVPESLLERFGWPA